MLLVHTWYDLEWLKVKYTIVQGIVNIRCSCTNDCNFISSDVNNLQKYHASNILFQLASVICEFLLTQRNEWLYFGYTFSVFLIKSK